MHNERLSLLISVFPIYCEVGRVGCVGVVEDVAISIHPPPARWDCPIPGTSFYTILNLKGIQIRRNML